MPGSKYAFLRSPIKRDRSKYAYTQCYHDKYRYSRLAVQLESFQHFCMSTSTLLNVFHVFSGAGATLSAFWHVLADPPCSKYAFLQCYQDLGLLKVCIFTVLLRQVSLLARQQAVQNDFSRERESNLRGVARERRTDA